MIVIVLVLALIGYVGLLIDWREFRGVLSQGGWVAICMYGLIAIIICAVWVTPAVVATPGLG